MYGLPYACLTNSKMINRSVKQNFTKIAQRMWKVSIFINTFKPLIKARPIYANIRENILQYTRIYAKIYSNIREYTRKYTPIYANIRENISQYTRKSWTQQIFVHISRAELYPNRTKMEKIGRMLVCNSK